MRERGKKKDGQRNVIPPQIFNGQEFRGVSFKTRNPVALKGCFVNFQGSYHDDNVTGEYEKQNGEIYEVYK